MQAQYLKPEILTHPNIPKPLHGTSPRTILGDVWWNKTRQEAYARNDYHCIACGVHKTKAQKHKWLEAHEFYKIDYENGVVEIESIEPLCHYCHNFIHSGRLRMIMGKEKSKQEVVRILEHGFSILYEANLKCFSGTLELAEEIGCPTFGVKCYADPVKIAPWELWRLVIEGKSYKGQFETFESWKTFYKKN